MKKVEQTSAGDRRHNRLIALLLVAYEIKAVPLPPPLPQLIRAVYRLTPLKRNTVQSPNQ
jgi:hypothetical protein